MSWKGKLPLQVKTQNGPADPGTTEFRLIHLWTMNSCLQCELLQLNIQGKDLEHVRDSNSNSWDWYSVWLIQVWLIQVGKRQNFLDSSETRSGSLMCRLSKSSITTHSVRTDCNGSASTTNKEAWPRGMDSSRVMVAFILLTISSFCYYQFE